MYYLLGVRKNNFMGRNNEQVNGYNLWIYAVDANGSVTDEPKRFFITDQKYRDFFGDMPPAEMYLQPVQVQVGMSGKLNGCKLLPSDEE